jgi:mannitol/fructose-specific phosphotransferase system IIA component (Ntr-type)
MSEQQPKCFPSLSLTEEEKYEAIEQALQKLAREGAIHDFHEYRDFSGRA